MGCVLVSLLIACNRGRFAWTLRRRDEEREQSAVRGADRGTDQSRPEAAPTGDVRSLDSPAEQLCGLGVATCVMTAMLAFPSHRGRGPLDLEKLDLPSNHPFAVKRKVGLALARAH